MPVLQREGIHFHYRDEGEGVPFVFQHGLGGDTSQTFGIYRPPPGFRMLTLDCRAHGLTRPVGDESKIGIAAFSDDVLALLDHLNVDRAVLGGISMGAATALNLALRHPERLMGLVLSRPAWLDARLPPNVQVFPRIAALLRQFGAREGLARFRVSEDYTETLRVSKDSAQALVGQFEHPRAMEAVARLERIPQDTPSLDRNEWRSIHVPTLVLANRQDNIHPFEYGQVLASIIPGAEFRELTPKSVSLGRHVDDVEAAISGFLQRHFLAAVPSSC